jgi:hypothetical protein
MMVHVLGLVLGLQGGGVEGTVRAVEDGRVLAQVLVEATGEHRWVVSDSLGRYHLADLSAGTHRLRFQLRGRVVLELTALVPAATTVHLDVELTQKPQELAPVVVMAPKTANDSEPPVHPPGATPSTSTWALRAPAAGRDLESALMNADGALSHGVGGGTLHFQGGASDHLLLTLDGFPLYAAKHFGSAWSAINPDAIQDISLHTGASPSEDGGRLSGTVSVRSTLLGGDSVHARGAVTLGDVRQLLRGELPGDGRFLLSGRRSLRNFFVDGTTLSEDNGYDDWLASMALRVGPGRLRLLFFHAANQLAFESRADTSSGQGGASDPVTAPSTSPNSLEWVSHTAGIAWDGRVGKQSLGLKAWRAGLGTSVQWQDPNRPLGLSDRFVELGIRGQATWLLGQGDITAGLSVRATLLTGPPVRPRSRLLQHCRLLRIRPSSPA